MIKNLTTGATEQAFTFDSCQYLWVKNTGDSTVYISPYSNIVAGADNVATLVSGDAVRIPAPANKLYTLGQGTLAVHAINTEESPFNKSGKGGGSGDGVHFRGSTTTALTDGATTNPITIDGSSYTAVMGDMVIYGNKEFLFDGTKWNEMGDLSDTVGRKYYHNGVAKGEIFNDYTYNVASNLKAHAEGERTTASGLSAHSEGLGTVASGDYSHAEGYYTAAANYSHAEGSRSEASGYYSHAEGGGTAPTDHTTASGASSHAEGIATTASGNYSHAEGYGAYVTGTGAHGEGESCTASGNYSHAEGSTCHAEGIYSHAEGDSSQATGVASHAEGNGSNASGDYSHAESNGYATGDYSHAEGERTTASGLSAHSEGLGTVASGDYSHAEGNTTVASGIYSHAEGYETVASGAYSHVSGKYNDFQSGDLFEIGNGTSDNARSNIVEVSSTYLNVNGAIKANGVAIPTAVALTYTAETEALVLTVS